MRCNLILLAFLTIACNAIAQDAGKKPPPLVITAMPPDKREPTGVGSQVVRVNVDGSDRKPLTSKDEFCGDPALSPDGKRVAFVVLGGDERVTGLYVMNADGSGRKRIVTTAKLEAEILAPCWSPDGKRLAFSSAVFNFKSRSLKPRLYLVDPDGANLKRLDKADGLMPAWSPDGKRLLFTREEQGGSEAPSLCQCDMDGANVKQLVAAGPMIGAWSPDGKWLAYVVLESLNVRGKSGLFLTKADGSEPKRLFGGAEDVVYGVNWSADSKRLFFTRIVPKDKAKARPAVHVIDLDGRNLQRLNTGDEPAYVGGTYLLAALIFRR